MSTMTISPLYPSPVTKKEFQGFESRIEQSFQTADGWFETIDANFKTVDECFKNVHQNFTFIFGRFNDLEVRFDQLDVRVSEGFEAMEKYVNNSFIAFGKELDKKLDRKLDQDYFTKYMDDFKKELLRDNSTPHD